MARADFVGLAVNAGRQAADAVAASVAEFCILFVGIPLAIAWFKMPGLLILAVWGGGLVAWLSTRDAAADPAPRIVPRLEVGFVAARFAVLGGLLTVAMWQALPHNFLDAPIDHTRLWAAIMILYPALSVLPQEMIYRRFIFRRYAKLLPPGRFRVAASAGAFAFAHIIFLNPWAVLLTGIGGVLFAETYARTQRIPYVWLEHALYGCLIFTIGLGRFFYTGTAWH